MKTVIILHNMTVEDEAGSEFEDKLEYDQNACTEASISTSDLENNNFDSWILHYHRIQDIHLHNRLKAKLIEHLCAKLGWDPKES